MPIPPRVPRLALTSGVLLAAGVSRCSDPAGVGDDGARLYQLRAVVDVTTGYTSISSGNSGDADILLRANGTYGSRGNPYAIAETDGSWRQSGDSLQLAPSDPLIPATHSSLAGDTLAFRATVQQGRTTYITSSYRYVRAPLPRSALAGTRWVLRTVNGAAPQAGSGWVVFSSTGNNGRPAVTRVLYDTLTFDDRVFYHDVRLVVDSVTDSTGVLRPDSFFPVSRYTATGAYEAPEGSVTLRYGSYIGYAPETFTYAGSDLVRRHAFRSDKPLVEAYERIP